MSCPDTMTELGDQDRSKPLRSRTDSVDLPNRLALRPKEAAQALGISERKLREMLPELPHVRRAGVVMLPVDGLKQWLTEEAEAEGRRTTAVAEEIVAEIRGRSE